MKIEEWICYQRTIIAPDSEEQVRLMAATDPATISISASVHGGAFAHVAINGKYGADLLVALSGVYTASTQGLTSMNRIESEAAVSFKTGGVAITVSNGVSTAEIPVTLCERVIKSLQMLLNDITGEYRRQVDELEKAA